MTDDSRPLEQELLTFVRLYPRLHDVRGSTEVLVARAEYAVLWLLDSQGPLQLGQVARALELDASTVTRHAQLLTKKGLTRGTMAADRRVTMLELTDSGRRSAREVTADRLTVLAALMSDWTADDRQAFLTLLGRFNFDTSPPGVR